MEIHYHVKELMFLIRPKTTDISIIREVIVHDIYGTANQIQDGDIVIDIGAHVGSFTVHACTLEARVLAFEPATVNFDLLKRNVELNGYSAELYKLGVMDPGGKKTFYIRDVNLGGSSFYDESDLSEEVETITLKEVFDIHEIGKCDFLKIDCEGAEYDILKGFPYFDRVRRIALEYVGDRIRDNIMGLLRQAGYIVTLRANERMGYIYAGRTEDEVPIR